MVRTQIYIPTKLHKKTKLYSSMVGASLSEFVRKGLKIIIDDIEHKKNNKNPLINLVGKYSGNNKNKDASLKHNDIYEL